MRRATLPKLSLRYAIIVIAVGLLSACVTTGDEGSTAIPATAAKLSGLWEGSWQRIGSGQHGMLHVEFADATSASYNVTDSDGATYDWHSSVSVNESTVTIKSQSFDRVDTLSLAKAGAHLKLTGTYTYQGKPWGRVSLTKQ